MSAYLALRWPTADQRADHVALAVRATIDRLEWHCVIEGNGWIVAIGPDRRRAPPVKIIGGSTIVIGHAFARAATDHGRVAAALIPQAVADFATLCDDLVARSWGSYVAIGSDPDDADHLDIFRDPVGALECVTWTCGAVRLVSSAPHLFLSDAAPADLAIDWQRVAELLLRPASAGETLPLTRLTAVPAGSHRAIGRVGARETIKWSPARFGEPRYRTPDDAGRAIMRMVDACVAAWASRSTLAVAELSGGLDSAIVAAALAQAPTNPVATWFNYFAADRQGDERRYARAVAERLDLALVESLRDQRAIDQTIMDALPVEARPNLGSLSLFHDQDLSQRAFAAGADTLFTGQGGDALFFQPATPLVAADLWRDPRPLRAKLAVLFDIAVWTGRPIWSILAAAARPRSAEALAAYPLDLVDRAIPRTNPSFAWMAGTAHLSSAKQLQVLNLATCRAVFANSWCSGVMNIFHPLLSQPLIETILPIPVLTLTGGRRDRALARDAFAARLPALLVERRGKGALTAFYGRMLAASTPFLRDYLLGGRLAEQRLLDCALLETILDPDHLMQHNAYAELLMVLLAERWARVWSDRIGQIRAAAGG